MKIGALALQRALATLPDAVTVQRFDDVLGTAWLLVGGAPAVVRVSTGVVWGLAGVERPLVGDLRRRGAWLGWAQGATDVAAPTTYEDLGAIIAVVADRAARLTTGGVAV